MSKYFFVLLLSLIFPLILSFYHPLKFYEKKSWLLISLLITFIVFGIWDVFATARGHWWFEPTGVWGIYFINLPVEEWLFFLVIPFCCLFTWEIIKYIATFFNKKGSP